MTASNVELNSCLNAIRVYASLQGRLIAALELGVEANEVNFRALLPKEVFLDKAKWYAVGHGVGVRFTSQETGEVVDAHEGFIESPNAFDAWRLSLYFESVGKKPDDRIAWKSLLQAFHESGVIRPDESKSDLFVISESGGL